MSDWSAKRRGAKEEAEQNQPSTLVQELAGSFFAVLTMLVMWASGRSRKTSQWQLSSDFVQARATVLLRAILRTFVTASVRQTIPGTDFEVELIVEDEHVKVGWRNFCKAEELQQLRFRFPADTETVDLVEALVSLCQDEINTNANPKRKSADLRGGAVLVLAASLCIETSRKDTVWQETELWQLQPLRTVASRQPPVPNLQGLGFRV
jgi:hypothetical protein